MNGELIGDPLDVKMFQSTGWVLDESNEEKEADDLILAYVRPPNSNSNYKNLRADSMLSVSEMSSSGKDMPQ